MQAYGKCKTKGKEISKTQAKSKEVLEKESSCGAQVVLMCCCTSKLFPTLFKMHSCFFPVFVLCLHLLSSSWISPGHAFSQVCSYSFTHSSSFLWVLMAVALAPARFRVECSPAGGKHQCLAAFQPSSSPDCLCWSYHSVHTHKQHFK